MTDFAFGDYVMYNNRELGRVIGVRADGNVSVCYSTGCTAGSTPACLLTRATREQIATVPDASRFGFHRFDGTCPKYQPEICAAFCPDKQ